MTLRKTLSFVRLFSVGFPCDKRHRPTPSCVDAEVYAYAIERGCFRAARDWRENSRFRRYGKNAVSYLTRSPAICWDDCVMLLNQYSWRSISSYVNILWQNISCVLGLARSVKMIWANFTFVTWPWKDPWKINQGQRSLQILNVWGHIYISAP